MSMLLSAVAGQGGIKVPGAPGTLSLGSATASTIALTWSAPSDTGGGTISGYRIKRDGSVIVADTSSTGTTYTATGLSAATSYSFTVAAINEKGTGADGNTPSLSTLAIPVYSASGAAQDTTYTYGGQTYRMLRWTSSGSLTISANAASTQAEVTVVAGGGGGSCFGGNGTGGGGGVRQLTGQTLTVGTSSITIGGGGSGYAGAVHPTGDGSPGNTSTFNSGAIGSSYSASGGGGGGYGAQARPGLTGGCGGGASASWSAGGTGGTGNSGGYSPVEGYNGGNGGYAYGATKAGGGGGGAGGAGQNGSWAGSGNGGLGRGDIIYNGTVGTTAAYDLFSGGGGASGTAR